MTAHDNLGPQTARPAHLLSQRPLQFREGRDPDRRSSQQASIRIITGPSDSPDKIDFKEMLIVSGTFPLSAGCWPIRLTSPELNAKLPDQLLKDMKSAKDQGWGKLTPVMPPLPNRRFWNLAGEDALSAADAPVALLGKPEVASFHRPSQSAGDGASGEAARTTFCPACSVHAGEPDPPTLNASKPRHWFIYLSDAPLYVWAEKSATLCSAKTGTPVTCTEPRSRKKLASCTSSAKTPGAHLLSACGCRCYRTEFPSHGERKIRVEGISCITAGATPRPLTRICSGDALCGCHSSNRPCPSGCHCPSAPRPLGRDRPKTWSAPDTYPRIRAACNAASSFKSRHSDEEPGRY